MAFEDKSAEARKEKTWIDCVDLHFEALKTQRLVETGKDGLSYAEAHADLYRRGREVFERHYNSQGDNETLYAKIAKVLPSKPLFSPRIPISASDTAIVERQLKQIPLEAAIGHQTKAFGNRTRAFLKAITPQQHEE